MNHYRHWWYRMNDETLYLVSFFSVPIRSLATPSNADFHSTRLTNPPGELGLEITPKVDDCFRRARGLWLFFVLFFAQDFVVGDSCLAGQCVVEWRGNNKWQVAVMSQTKIVECVPNFSEGRDPKVSFFFILCNMCWILLSIQLCFLSFFGWFHADYRGHIGWYPILERIGQTAGRRSRNLYQSNRKKLFYFLF